MYDDDDHGNGGVHADMDADAVAIWEQVTFFMARPKSSSLVVIYHSASLSCPYPNWIKSLGAQITQGFAVAPQCHGNSGGASAAGRSAARGRVRSHVAQCRTQAGLEQDDNDQPSPVLPHLL